MNVTASIHGKSGWKIRHYKKINPFSMEVFYCCQKVENLDLQPESKVVGPPYFSINPFTALKLSCCCCFFFFFFCRLWDYCYPKSLYQNAIPLPTHCLNVALNSGVHVSTLWSNTFGPDCRSIHPFDSSKTRFLHCDFLVDNYRSSVIWHRISIQMDWYDRVERQIFCDTENSIFSALRSVTRLFKMKARQGGSGALGEGG